MKKVLVWLDVKEENFDNVPNKCGVYVISCKCKDDKYHVVYTGQSEDVQRRLKEHWSENETNEDLKKVISNYRSAFKGTYALVDKKSELDGCEKFLFDYYNPQFAERAPDVEPADITLSSTVVKGKVSFKK